MYQDKFYVLPQLWIKDFQLAMIFRLLVLQACLSHLCPIFHHQFKNGESVLFYFWQEDVINLVTIVMPAHRLQSVKIAKIFSFKDLTVLVIYARMALKNQLLMEYLNVRNVQLNIKPVKWTIKFAFIIIYLTNWIQTVLGTQARVNY